MARLLRQEMVGSKIDLLVKHRDNILEQRNYLETLLDEANEVLQLATSWLRNYDGANDVTFKDINKMIEDKLLFLSSTDVSVDCEKAVMQQKTTTITSLPTGTSSTDQPLLEGSSSTDQPLLEGSSSTDQPLLEGSSSTDQPLPAVSTSSQFPMPTRHDQVLDELKSIANQVKVMQDDIAFLSKSTWNISEKQLTMEKFSESLSAQCFRIEREQIRKIEPQLKNIDENQKKTILQQNTKIKLFENKITAVTKTQSVLEEKLKLQQAQLDNVCDQMTSILPKIAQLEIHRRVIGSSACLSGYFDADTINTTTALCNFRQIVNNGNHFNPATGEFTAPLNGLYATSLSLQCEAALDFFFTIRKQPCTSCFHPNRCDKCFVCEISTSKDQRSVCAFVVVDMKAGEKLSIMCRKKGAAKVYYDLNVMFVCFRIG